MGLARAVLGKVGQVRATPWEVGLQILMAPGCLLAVVSDNTDSSDSTVLALVASSLCGTGAGYPHPCREITDEHLNLQPFFLFFSSGAESCLAQARCLATFHFQTTVLFTVADIALCIVEWFVHLQEKFRTAVYIASVTSFFV